MKRVIVVGLTGGVAAGKSEVARIFREEHGIPIVDADAVARELRGPGGAAEGPIESAFGKLSDEKLRALVFNDATARARLEAILHPLIRAESARRISEVSKSSAPFVLYEAALLFETDRDRELDATLVVMANPEVRERRLTARLQRAGLIPAMAAEQARAMLAVQAKKMTDEERRKRATRVIENDGEIDHLRRRIAELIGDLSWCTR